MVDVLLLETLFRNHRNGFWIISMLSQWSHLKLNKISTLLSHALQISLLVGNISTNVANFLFIMF